MPMGWSWAVYLCQHAIERAVRSAEELGPRQMAADFERVPDIHEGEVHTVYVDNHIVASTEADTVTRAVEGARVALNSRGLLTHEEEGGSFDYRALGVSIGGDPALTSLTKKRNGGCCMMRWVPILIGDMLHQSRSKFWLVILPSLR